MSDRTVSLTRWRRFRRLIARKTIPRAMNHAVNLEIKSTSIPVRARVTGVTLATSAVTLTVALEVTGPPTWPTKDTPAVLVALLGDPGLPAIDRVGGADIEGEGPHTTTQLGNKVSVMVTPLSRDPPGVGGQ